MKKLISIFLTVCMCFSIGMVLTSCGDNENHEHTYKTEWTYDDTYHWHACEGEDCTDVSDKAEHTWNDGEITTEATAEADGVKTFTCTVCGNTKTEVVKYVAQDVDKSGYSIFNEEDHYCIVKHNQIGLPVEVYSESAFSGERDYGDRDLEWSIEYTSDNLISSIVSSYRHYEFEYNQYDGMGMELTRKEMKKWEKAMENSDGSRGFKFKEEQILPITQQHGIKFGKDFSEEEFVLAVNMLYSDYCKVLGGDLQLYIKMAKAFLCDDDFDGTGSEKLALYYRYIVDNEG